MAAAATLAELPPLTAPLTLLPSAGGEAALADAETLVATQRYPDAAYALQSLWHDVRHDPALAYRQRIALAWCELYLGELQAAADLLEHAATLVAAPQFDAADRAEVLFRQGCVALKQAKVADAAALFTRALASNERAPLPRPSLASRAYEWRARCHVCRRDFDAAKADVELAVDLALAADDADAHASALFQASIVAERRRDWLVARCYAEQALALYRRLGNDVCVARLLNNVGGIDFLLGDVDAAERSLLAAIETADAAGTDADRAQAVNSLAQVYLRSGRPLEARARALRAIDLLAARSDYRDELGNAQLVVARSYEAEGDSAEAATWLAHAEQTYAALGSTSHLATIWLARGDLARANGDADAAASLYRQAAELLQDVHF